MPKRTNLGLLILGITAVVVVVFFFIAFVVTRPTSSVPTSSTILSPQDRGAAPSSLGSIINNYYGWYGSGPSLEASDLDASNPNSKARWIPGKVCTDSRLISASDLLSLVGGPSSDPPSNVVILDVAASQTAFNAGHIKGARFINWLIDLAEIPYPGNGLYELPKRADFQNTLRGLGVDYTSKIIFTDERLGAGRAFNRLSIRAYFVFKYFGFENMYILNGGNAAWRAAGGQLVNTPSVYSPSMVTVALENLDMIAFFETVLANLREPKTHIVDARPHLMYYGWNYTCTDSTGTNCIERGPFRGGLIHTGAPVSRGGHILNAVNFPWANNFAAVTETIPMSSNTVIVDYFKSTADLYQIYSPLFKPNQLIILSCNEGIHAVTDWFVIDQILCFKNNLVYEGSAGEYAVNAPPGGAPYTAPMVSGYDRYDLGTISASPYTITP